MAGDSKNARSERDPQSLVADLLRRATSPEVLAGVAGAAAAARFTKHLVEDADEPEVEESSDSEESDETHDTVEDEPADDERDETSVEEDDTDEDERDEPSAEEDEPDEEGRDEPHAEEEQEPKALAESDPDQGGEAEPEEDEGAEERGEASDSSAASNGSGTDAERMELLEQARRYAEQLTGHPVESFSSLERDDRGWRIGMEVVELSRVPSTTDVLGSYELVLTDEGEFVDFRRGHRYSRNSTDDA